MKYHVPERVVRDIRQFARAHDIERVLLFGSRARGDNAERSDIDLAVWAGEGAYDSFYWDVQEKTHSLLRFDIINMNGPCTQELMDAIKRDGVLLYEKNR